MTERHALSWPRDDCSRVPYPVFSDGEIFDLEQERIFRVRCENHAPKGVPILLP